MSKAKIPRVGDTGDGDWMSDFKRGVLFNQTKREGRGNNNNSSDDEDEDDDPRSELLLKNGPLVPQATSSQAYWGFESALYVNDEVIKKIIEKDANRRIESLNESGLGNNHMKIDITNRYEELLEKQLQSRKSLPLRKGKKSQQEHHPKNKALEQTSSKIDIKEDGTIVVNLPRREPILVHKIRIPLVNLSEEEVNALTGPGQGQSNITYPKSSSIPSRVNNDEPEKKQKKMTTATTTRGESSSRKKDSINNLFKKVVVKQNGELPLRAQQKKTNPIPTPTPIVVKKEKPRLKFVFQTPKAKTTETEKVTLPPPPAKVSPPRPPRLPIRPRPVAAAAAVSKSQPTPKPQQVPKLRLANYSIPRIARARPPPPPVPAAVSPPPSRSRSPIQAVEMMSPPRSATIDAIQSTSILISPPRLIILPANAEAYSPPVMRIIENDQVYQPPDVFLPPPPDSPMQAMEEEDSPPPSQSETVFSPPLLLPNVAAGTEPSFEELMDYDDDDGDVLNIMADMDDDFGLGSF